MITKRNVISVLILLECLTYSSLATENHFGTQSELHLDVSDKPVPRKMIRLTPDYSYPEMTHIGVIHIKWDRELRGLGRWFSHIQNTKTWDSMSLEQREFMQRVDSDFHEGKRIGKIFRQLDEPREWDTGPFTTPQGTRTYLFYGVTVEDTGKMAEALVEWLNGRAAEALKKSREELADARTTINNAQKELDGLTPAMEQAEQDVRKKLKEYVVDKRSVTIESSIWDVHDDAEARRLEYNRQLWTINVELAGIKAKLEAIDRLERTPRRFSKDVPIMLEKMRIAADIDLAGALASEALVDKADGEAKAILELIDRHVEVCNKVYEQKQLLTDRQHKKVAELEATLADPPGEMRPVEVYENSVFISPVVE